MSRLSRLPLVSRIGSWRSLVAGIVVGAVGCAVVAALVLPPWLLDHHSSLPGEVGFGRFAVALAARLHAGAAAATPGPVSGEALRRGEYAYLGSCALCHGATGDGTGAALAASLFPPPTSLVGADAKAKSDAELFWITKHGLSFTAMPGFAQQYNDEAITAIVAYVRALQHGTAPRSLAVPPPTAPELAKAELAGGAVARGAAVYFAQGCQLCHGAAGNAPDELRLREVSSSNANLACTIRNGPNGMPAYGTAELSDAQLTSLMAYLRSLPAAARERERARLQPAGTPAPGATPVGPSQSGSGGGGDGGGAFIRGDFGRARGVDPAQRYSSQAAVLGTFTGCPGGR